MKILRKKSMYISCRKKCSLLIPEYIYPFYEEMLETYKDMRHLLHFLLKKYYRNNSYFRHIKDIDTTCSYQEDGLSLAREDFRPIEWDWIEIKLLASSNNMSICAFFVLLLRLEMAGVLEGKKEFGQVPPKFKKIILHQSITRYSIPNFKRLLHLQI